MTKPNGTEPAVKDPAIDAAIAAAEDKPKPVEMVQLNMRLAPQGRPAFVALPQDISEMEVMALIGELVKQIVLLRAQRNVVKAKIVGLDGRPV